MSLSSPGSSSFVQLVPDKKKISIFVLFASVIKMWKIAPNWLAHLKVEIILFWYHGHCKMNIYLVWLMLICSTSDTTLKVVMLKTRGHGKDSLKHQLRINEKLLLKVFHLVLKVHWKRVKTTVNMREKPCIFCKQFKCQGNTKKYRISEVNVAKTLL